MPRKSTKIRMIFCENKKYRILRRAGHTWPAAYGKRDFAERAAGGHLHPLPCGRIFRHRQHQHRLCPARRVPGKATVPPWARMICSTTCRPRMWGVFSPFTGLQGVQHGGQVAHAVVGYRDPQCFSCAHREGCTWGQGCGRPHCTQQVFHCAGQQRGVRVQNRLVGVGCNFNATVQLRQRAVTELGGQPAQQRFRPESVGSASGCAPYCNLLVRFRSSIKRSFSLWVRMRTPSAAPRQAGAVSCSSCSAQPESAPAVLRTSWLTPRSNLCGHRPAGR